MWLLEEWDKELSSGKWELAVVDLLHLSRRAFLLLSFLENFTFEPVGIPDPTSHKRTWEKEMGLFRNQHRVMVDFLAKLEFMLDGA